LPLLVKTSSTSSSSSRTLRKYQVRIEQFCDLFTTWWLSINSQSDTAILSIKTSFLGPESASTVTRIQFDYFFKWIRKMMILFKLCTNVSICLKCRINILNIQVHQMNCAVVYSVHQFDILDFWFNFCFSVNCKFANCKGSDTLYTWNLALEFLLPSPFRPGSLQGQNFQVSFPLEIPKIFF